MLTKSKFKKGDWVICKIDEYKDTAFGVAYPVTDLCLEDNFIAVMGHKGQVLVDAARFELCSTGMKNPNVVATRGENLTPGKISAVYAARELERRCKEK